MEHWKAKSPTRRTRRYKKKALLGQHLRQQRKTKPQLHPIIDREAYYSEGLNIISPCEVPVIRPKTLSPVPLQLASINLPRLPTFHIPPNHSHSNTPHPIPATSLIHTLQCMTQSTASALIISHQTNAHALQASSKLPKFYYESVVDIFLHQHHELDDGESDNSTANSTFHVASNHCAFSRSQGIGIKKKRRIRNGVLEDLKKRSPVTFCEAAPYFGLYLGTAVNTDALQTV